MDRVLSRFWIERGRPAALPLGLALAGAGWGLVLARLEPPAAILWTLLAALAVGTAFEPLVGLVGALLLGLLRAYLQTEVPQVPAQIGHLYVALAAAVWVAHGLARRDLRIPTPPLLLPLLGFVGAGWLSLWNATDLAAYGVPELVKWLEVLLVFLIVADRAQPRHLPWLVGGVLLVGALQAGVGVYQFALRGDGPDHFLIPGTDFYRAYGTFEQPNPYAGYVSMSAALAVGVVVVGFQEWWHKRRHSERVEAGFAFVFLPAIPAVLMITALGMSWSRGAWIGFAAALGAMAVALPRRTRWGVLLAGTLVVLFLLLYATGLLPAAVVARLTDFAAGLRLEDVRGVGITPANYAVIERLAHWQSALAMWRARFWTGVGLGCYEPAYTTFALVNWPIALGHAHNIYLNLLAETGLVGLLAYALLWGAVLWRTWQATRRARGLARGVAIGLLGAWVHLAMHNLFDNLYVNNVHLLVGLMLGLLAIVLTNNGTLCMQTPHSSFSRREKPLRSAS
ncbi:MAG: O-antigen ligase family protein [Anaerolineae bacterium]|nr:O-antigen ligase family protein [Anaerolineae bacterium]